MTPMVWNDLFGKNKSHLILMDLNGYQLIVIDHNESKWITTLTEDPDWSKLILMDWFGVLWVLRCIKFLGLMEIAKYNVDISKCIYVNRLLT